MAENRARRRPDRARRAAFDVLRAVHADDAYANLALADRLAERRLPERDAAFATELVAGTCRWQGSYDRILVAAAGRELSTLQPAVVDVLRLGVHQLLSLRVPDHAAVAASVDLAAATVGERVTGLVNAVLRRVAVRDRDGWFADLGGGLDAPERLALETAHPRWIVDAYADVLPPEELRAALDADNDSPAVTLAARPGLADVAELVEAGGTAGRWSPYAARWPGDPHAVAAVREGRTGVQDEGSQLVAWLLTRSEAPVGPWLDLCAGPGGKAGLLAGLAPTGTLLLAAELAPHRAQLVAAAGRGYPRERRAAVVSADGTRPAWRSGRFARVLVDVPCTGLGALRRRPEARWRRTSDAVEQLHPLQVALLQSAVDAVAPGGVVAYVTCSPHPRETEVVVRSVLADRPELTLLSARSLWPEGPTDAFAGDFLQLWPHRHGTDAMFAAYLRRAVSA